MKIPQLNIDSEIAHLEEKKGKLARLLQLQSEVTVMEKRLIAGGTDTAVVSRIFAEVVCRHFQITTTHITSRSREEFIAIPRQIIFYLIHKLHGAGWSAIARVFQRDHGTIMHGYKAVADRISVDKSFAEGVAELEAQCLAKLHVTEETK